MVTTPISKPFWQRQLRHVLVRLQKAEPAARLAIVGVGNELAGDDAFGPLVVRTLKKNQIKGSLRSPLLVIDAGLAPESFSGGLRQFRPAMVILIDAAQMGLDPGEIRWLAWEEAQGLSASTHTLPLAMFSSYLAQELGCEVALLGVQPQRLELGEPLSPPLRLAKRRIVGSLVSILNNYP